MGSDDSKSSSKIPIIVAIIGLTGTLLTVIINKWPVTNNSNTASAAIHCVVTGTVYNTDQNNAPMPESPVGFITNNNFHRITLTGSNGTFTADFSALTKDQFPFILFVRYNKVNIATGYRINENGSEGLNIYISPKTIESRHPGMLPMHSSSTLQNSR